MPLFTIFEQIFQMLCISFYCICQFYHVYCRIIMHPYIYIDTHCIFHAQIPKRIYIYIYIYIYTRIVTSINLSGTVLHLEITLHLIAYIALMKYLPVSDYVNKNWASAATLNLN